MKRTLLLILALGVVLLGACSANPIKHYVNEEFGYSIDYPKDWILEEFNPNEIGIMPKDSDYNQIQIGAFHGEPMIGSLSESLVATSTEVSLQQSFDMLGGTNLNIIVNEPASGKWDWVVTFTVIYEDTQLRGGEYIKEIESTTYTIFYVQNGDWSEGWEVIDSFSLSE